MQIELEKHFDQVKEKKRNNLMGWINEFIEEMRPYMIEKKMTEMNFRNYFFWGRAEELGEIMGLRGKDEECGWYQQEKRKYQNKLEEWEYTQKWIGKKVKKKIET
jgi:hypothetical protein